MASIFSAFRGKQKIGSKITGPSEDRSLPVYYGSDNSELYGVIRQNTSPQIITNYVSYAADSRKAIGEPSNATENSNSLENRDPRRKPFSYERGTGVLNYRDNRNLEYNLIPGTLMPNTAVYNYRNKSKPHTIVEDYYETYSENAGAGDLKGATFRDENIFLLDGHGSDSSLNKRASRYKLKEGQYALIPGRCGSILTANTNISKSFFEYNKPIEIFNTQTRDNFSILEFSKVSINQITKITTKKNSGYKHYRPPLNNKDKEETISVPPLYIIPFNLQVKSGVLYQSSELDIIIGGILQKSQPYTFETNNSEKSKYYKSINIDNKYLDTPFKDFIESEDYSQLKHAINIFKESLAKSVLTFDDIVDLTIISKHMGLDGSIIEKMRLVGGQSEYEGWLNEVTIRDLTKLSLPVDFFFDFLDTKASKPYLLIFNVCRSVNDNAPVENIRRARALSQSGGRNRGTTRRRYKVGVTKKSLINRMKRKNQKTRRIKRKQRKSRSRRQRGGVRFVGNLNPGVYHREYAKGMDIMREVAAEQENEPRFAKFKELLQYFLDSQEIIKIRSLRDMIRQKIGNFYGLGEDFINNDVAYAELVQKIIKRINDLDARGVRHQVPN